MNSLSPGAVLTTGEELRSANGWLTLTVQDDGNVVLRRRQTGAALWSSRTRTQAVTELRMQKDGDLTACRADGTVAWNSRTVGNDGASLVLRDDGDLVVTAGDAATHLWHSDTVQDFTSPTIRTTDAFGFEYAEIAENWKVLCQDLPCFDLLYWPGYATKVFPMTIDGVDVVVQLWKGWCQKFLDLDTFPGGIGGEVGVYRRMPGRKLFTPRTVAATTYDNRFIVDDIKALSRGDVWWPDPDLSVRIGLTFVNSRTGDKLLEARPEETYWVGKWMREGSYLRYAFAHGSGFLLPTDYTLQYTINGETGQW